jgi:crotonobetainyl-CoA:carnitine CoA-transferase CaiB-like acyl-CoA transferase
MTAERSSRGAGYGGRGVRPARPLDGLDVFVAGPRAVLAGAAWLAQHGATVWHDDGNDDPDVDDLWLTRHFRAGRPGHEVDLALLAGGGPTGCRARVRARLFGASPRSAWSGRDLDERSLAAAAGVAIAVGDPDRDPLPVPDGLLDAMAGTHLAAAGLAGVLEGVSEVEVVAADAIAATVLLNANLYEPYGRPWVRSGPRASGSGGTYPYGILQAKDGPICLIGRTEQDFRGMLAAAGDPPWGEDPRFQDLEQAGRHHAAEIDALLAPWLERRTRAEIMADATTYRFPAGPVLAPSEVLEDPVLEPLWCETSSGDRRVRVPGAPSTHRVLGEGHHRPLRDCLVLDLGWVWSGPGVSAGLADLGATVVKVESCTRPDNTRLRRGLPAGAVPDDAPLLECSPYSHAINRGKQSISLDLKTPQGRAILRELADRADVIVENLSPGVMTRLGVDPDQVAERNPGCVYVSLRGYRPHPRTEGLRAYAPALSSAAGVESLVRYPGEPTIGMMTYAYSDASAVIQGLSLALAGLYARKSRGHGSVQTLFQHDGVVWANGRNLIAAQLGALGDLEPITDHEVVGAADLENSPAVGPDLVVRVPHRWLGHVRVAALPWHLDGVRPTPTEAMPSLGQDTVPILREVTGRSAEEIASLDRAGVLR